MRSHSGESSRVVRVPAITSECPFRYLVAACITMSAPSSSGRDRTGVATVESTATKASAACAISQVVAISVIDHSGFAGVSIQTSRVRPGCIDRRTASESVMSMNSTRSPHWVANVISQLRSDQYMTFGASTWSPGASAWNTAVAAAIPDANSSDACPPSSAVRTASA